MEPRWVGSLRDKSITTNFRRVASLLNELQEDGVIQIGTLANQPDQVAVTAGPKPMDEPARQKAAEIRLLLNVTRPPAPAEASPAAPEGATGKPGDAEPVPNGPVELESGGFPRNPARVMVTGRSILGVMAFLAQLVEVPPEHVRKGLAHQTRGKDGKPFDWNEISHGMFRVRSSTAHPEGAFLAVFYRGYWFYIDDTDLESKSTYTLLAQLLSLQSASGSMQAPVLTIRTR